MDKLRKISFIGGGNMAKAIVGGLINQKYPNNKINISDIDERKGNGFKTKYGINFTTQNKESLTGTNEALILATKPNIIPLVLKELSPLIKEYKPIVISIAAGISTNSIRNFISSSTQISIVRAMPNTACLISQGSIGLFAPSNVNDETRSIVRSLFSTVAKEIHYVTQEQHLDVITGISGSSPAYFYLILESMISKATNYGLSFDVAAKLATQAMVGSGLLLLKELKDQENTSIDLVKGLRKNVTSPNGTTHAAIQSLIASGMEKAFEDAVEKAVLRSVELEKEGAN